MVATPLGVKREFSTCVFSDDRKYRYYLQHRVRGEYDHDHKGLVNFIMLNPSTADEQRLDPTLRRCRGYALLWGYGSFAVTNLFAYRATLPTAMMQATDPIGPDNDRHLLNTARLSNLVVLAWGAHGSHRNRSQAVRSMLERLSTTSHITHLGLTAAGEPRHPLYLSIGVPLTPAFTQL